jgi:carboxynorspermidine decarboxylase
MSKEDIKNKVSQTPAYVFDERQINHNLSQLVALREKSACQVLYSIKALPLARVLYKAKDYLDGLSVSSLFEARLAKEVLGDSGSIHITTPGIRDDEFSELGRLCTHISFNSISQHQRAIQSGKLASSLGYRLNPQLSFAADPRFNPCREYSKLGVEIERLGSIPSDIEGLHFHTVFSHHNYLPLDQTVNLIKQRVGRQLFRLKWLNLGGGYLYSQMTDQQPFINLIKNLKSEFDLDIYIEPGKTVVGDAGYLVSTVIDSFMSGGKHVLVLDTSINHNPEVFEYQRQPELVESDEGGGYSYLLVGSSCLAGDLFGEYRFEQKLNKGDRVTFKNVGAYSLIKANRFNGYNLPDNYWLDSKGEMALVKHHTYDDYRQQWVE